MLYPCPPSEHQCLNESRSRHSYSERKWWRIWRVSCFGTSRHSGVVSAPSYLGFFANQDPFGPRPSLTHTKAYVCGPNHNSTHSVDNRLVNLLSHKGDNTRGLNRSCSLIMISGCVALTDSYIFSRPLCTTCLTSSSHAILLAPRSHKPSTL